MPGIAVNVAVIQEGRVLLTKREDFEVWCLPSGGVEDGESFLSRQQFYLQRIEGSETKETIEIEDRYS